jgi:hypothetical protein
MRLRAALSACADILFSWFDQLSLYKARAIFVHMRQQDVVEFEAVGRGVFLPVMVL